MILGVHQMHELSVDSWDSQALHSVCIILIDSWRMHRRVTVVVLSMCMCVCLSVTTKSATYLVYTLKTRCQRIFMVFSRICRVAFTENASLKSYGVIYQSLPPSSLPNDVSMDKRNCNKFFSTRRVCMSSDGSQNTTDSSLDS